MSLTDFEPLPEVSNVDDLQLGKLPALFTPFFVPFLEDKPQNPIIQRLQARTTPVLPKELLILSEQLADEKIFSEEETYDIWEEAARLGPSNEGRIASWDTPRKDEFSSQEASNSPFLSEQPVHVVSAARFHARPPLLTRSRRIWHVSSAELIDNLSSVLLGCSSAIYVWNNLEERFVMRKSAEEEEGYIFLDGMDEVASESYIKRFLTIGTHLRRLDYFALQLRNLNMPSSQKPATTYAFAHALSAVTIYLQDEITRRLRDIKKRGTSRLVDFWFHFDGMQTAAESVARLCGREFRLDVPCYLALPRRSPSELLSHIYNHLSEAQKQSGTSASLAFGLLSYIMTVTSKPYLSDIAEEIGLDGRTDVIIPKKLKHTESDRITDGVEEDEQDTGAHLEENLEDPLIATSFPAFISTAIGEAIIRAKRSIRILDVTDTPLLKHPRFVHGVELTGGNQLRWMWSEQEIVRIVDSAKGFHHLCEDAGGSGVYLDTRTANEESEAAVIEIRSYPDEIADAFRAFDLEPGCHLVGVSSARQNQALRVETFLSKFPDSLPSITPTLPLLADRILNPIILQADALGRASLRIFFGADPKDGGGGGLLHFRSHVVLLRSYLLTMGSSFRERLQNALFSDKAPGEELDERARTGQARPQRTRHDKNRRDSEYPSPSQPWVVGLARGLMVNSNDEHQSWPPGGSDLSFYLRRVITDSLELVRNAEFAHLSRHDNSRQHEEKALYSDEYGFWDDVEARLGFAIRDLPISTGPAKEKWMDPNSIEALDFLFMDYKPPLPLRTLITKEILSKYQRMFTFLLRLMRVQNAVRAVHRVAHHSKDRLFASNKSSRQLLEYFLFAAHGFVSALSSYVSQTAMGGNIDAFLARVAAAEAQSRSRSTDEAYGDERSEPLIFEDVHALAQAHSKTLNDILSACLQRASQHAYGDLLKSCLDVLLEFCALIGDLVSHKIVEEEAATKLGALWERWRGKVSVLAKALHKLVDKGMTGVHTPFTSHSSFGVDGGAEKHLPDAVGGVEALSDLLIRLDFSDWWKNLPLSK